MDRSKGQRPLITTTAKEHPLSLTRSHCTGLVELHDEAFRLRIGDCVVDTAFRPILDLKDCLEDGSSDGEQRRYEPTLCAEVSDPQKRTEVRK